MKDCIICKTPLQGKQNKYCSNKCKAKGHYDHVKNNTNTTYSQFKRGYIRKLTLIKMFGGECQECGYKKNVSALEFHHLRDKLFSLDSRNLSNRKWSTIIEEAKKCELMCGNCHTEDHNPELDMILLEAKYHDDVEAFILKENIKIQK